MPRFRHRQPEAGTVLPDETLVARAQAGDREAFGVLYDRYLPRVYGYCYRLLGAREAAEDANTEVFLHALTALPSYRPGVFSSWLFAIAHNVIVDIRRRPRADVPLDDLVEVVDPAPSLEDRTNWAVDQLTLMALLSRLSTDQQHVVALRLSGLSAVEIGEALGKPRNAIDGIHHRALLRLRSLVATGDAAATKGGG